MSEQFFRRLKRDQAGTTAVEYGVIAMLIAVAVAGTMLALGNEVETQYNTVSTEYAAANKGSS